MKKWRNHMSFCANSFYEGCRKESSMCHIHMQWYKHTIQHKIRIYSVENECRDFVVVNMKPYVSSFFVPVNLKGLIFVYPSDFSFWNSNSIFFLQSFVLFYAFIWDCKILCRVLLHMLVRIKFLFLFHYYQTRAKLLFFFLLVCKYCWCQLNGWNFKPLNKVLKFTYSG